MPAISKQPDNFHNPMTQHLATASVQLDIGWILAAIGSLCTTIATLAAVMWGFVQSRLKAQDAIIQAQSATITKLQDDVDRMSHGCGHPDCHWGQRVFPGPAQRLQNPA